jgi:protein-tyrosine phosphatase
LIDLHSHILPSIDDGATDVDMALDMGRMAVADGIVAMACTPHFMPGLYDNDAADVAARVAWLKNVFADHDVALELVVGGDAHLRPDFLACLRSGAIPTLHGSRYVLFEPPHVVKPPRMDDVLFNIQVSGFVPILTHPERLKWIEQDYDSIRSLAMSGVWMQITAGSLTGRFGKRPQYWAQRMLAEGLVSILATDAHNCRSRPPLLAEARDAAAEEVGVDEALRLVVTRPNCVLENGEPDSVPPCLAPAVKPPKRASILRRILGV